jgi:hypothetical protein
MRGKAVVVTLVVLAALGLPSCKSKAPQAMHKHVRILMRKDHSCQQVDAGTGGPADTPQLSRSGHDTIVWEQGIIVGSGPAPLVATFPPTKNGHIGTPFTSGGQPKFIFQTGDDSGPPDANAPYATYLYLSIKVGNDYCTNPGDPGVIIVN